MTFSRIVFSLLMVVCVGALNHASADDIEPASTTVVAPQAPAVVDHLAEARALLESGHFAEAAAKFREAHENLHAASPLMDAYLAYLAAGDLPHARDALSEYVETLPAGAASRQPFVDHLDALDARIRERDTNRAVVGRESALAPAATNAESGLEMGAETFASPTPTTTDRESPAQRPAAYTAISVGVAGFVAATVTGYLTMRKVSDIESQCGPHRTDCPVALLPERDAAHRLAVGTNAILITAGIVTAAGVAMLLFWPRETENAPRASAMCVPGACAANVSIPF